MEKNNSFKLSCKCICVLERINAGFSSSDICNDYSINLHVEKASVLYVRYTYTA